ncbi:MAG: hypothetical protein Q4Q62_00525 [Thermoplasmata archaeon]|nr:hypothetical protein [Thermoplasmata archaeon]
MAYNKKVVAVAVVIIVIVAAVAAAFAAGVFDKNDSGSASIDSQLQVMGNADLDYKIDSNDAQIIQDILDGSKSFSDYPYADANNDGQITQADLDQVNSMIAHTQTYVNVVCVGTDDNQTVVQVAYPLTNIVIQGTNNDSIICEIDAASVVAGYFYKYSVAHSGLDSATNLGGSARSVSATAWQNFMDLDASIEGGVGAIIADAGSSALSNYYDAIATSEIPLLRFAVSDTYDSISAAVTIGYLCGQTYEEKAISYAQKCWDAFDYISERISGLSDDQKKVFVAITMGKYIAKTESDYTHKAEYAGGLSLGDVNAQFAADYGGTGSSVMSSGEALSNYDDEIDYILSFRTIDYKTSLATAAEEEWAEYMSFYQNLSCYENLVIINGMLPQICQTAYAAAIMYPELFSMEWADSLLQSFITDSSSMGGVSFDDIITVFTYEDYQSVVNA